MPEAVSSTYVSLYLLSDGEGRYVVPEDEPQIDAAVSAYMDSGGRDCLLHLSTVSHWCVSTPETRQRVYHRIRAQKEERKEMEKAAGLTDWNDD